MSRPKGSIIGAKPTWTTTATSGIWTLRQAEEMKAANQWPRGPEAPTSLAGTPGNEQVALTWTAPATTHGTITDYIVEYTPAAGSPALVATGSTAASYTLTGVTNDTEYTFRVAAVNHTRGDFSSSVAVTPSAVVPGWDLSNAAYVQNFSVSSQDGSVTSLAFKSDGTKMYMLGNDGDDVNEYSLSTAWDISSASYTQNFSVASQEVNPFGIAFKTDGSRMYIAGVNGQDVNEYSLSTPWDISSASYVQNLSVSSQDGFPTGIAFKDDGTRMYVLGRNGSDVNEYSLSTAWDISSASYTQNFSVASQEATPHGIAFKPDGSLMYVVGDSSFNVNEYSLSTPWDISSASYVQNLSVSSQDGGPQSVAFKDDGTRMYMLGNYNDAVYEYSL